MSLARNTFCLFFSLKITNMRIIRSDFACEYRSLKIAGVYFYLELFAFIGRLHFGCNYLLIFFIFAFCVVISFYVLMFCFNMKIYPVVFHCFAARFNYFFLHINSDLTSEFIYCSVFVNTIDFLYTNRFVHIMY